MKRLILHIGPKKTGTSFIQHRLFKASLELSNSNIEYPNSLIPENYFGQHQLTKYLRNNQLTELNKAISLVSNDKDVLISTESLSYLNPNQLSVLADLFADYGQVEVACFVRNISDLLYSNWQSDVRYGSAETLYDFVVRQLENPASHIITNPRKVINKYKKAFANIDITLHPYDIYNENSKYDICYQFCVQQLGVKLHETYDKQLINKSDSLIEIEVLRLINKLYRDRHGSSNVNVRKAFRYLINRKEINVHVASDILSNNINTFEISHTTKLVQQVDSLIRAPYIFVDKSNLKDMLLEKRELSYINDSVLHNKELVELLNNYLVKIENRV